MRGFGKRGSKGLICAALLCLLLFALCGCAARETAAPPPDASAAEPPLRVPGTVVTFEHHLDGYQPQKKAYRFFFTYKLVHPWWDAVALGMEDAVAQFAEQGISINFFYVAPKEVSPETQIAMIRQASADGFDVIGVDVADMQAVTPVINELIDGGDRVMTFSSSDASAEDGCRRIAYVGNTHNREDGAALTEALCEKLGGSGSVAILVGSEGAPCHEERAQGAMEVLARYPGMEVAAVAYDDDSVDKAYDLTLGFLEQYPDLAGIICCNMSNSVGAARAVKEAGKAGAITIVGMDHAQEALRFLKEGTIYALGIQDCYSIGFDTIQTAVKLADGIVPSSGLFPEKTEEKTTIVFSDGAQDVLTVLYGNPD